jgi:hypothetical protein
MSPDELKRTIAANEEYAVAGPFEKPVTASMLVADGVASRSAVKDVVCVENAAFCHEVELVVQEPVAARRSALLPAQNAAVPLTATNSAHGTRNPRDNR